MFLWFERPFPLIERVKVKVFYIIFFGAFIGLFILLFRPFGFYNFGVSDIYKLAFAFGISSAASLAIASFIIPSSFPNFFVKEDWDIGRQIIFLFGFFVLFTISNWICYKIFGIGQFTRFSPLSIIGISFLLGIIPSVLFILIIEQRHFRRLQKEQENEISVNTNVNYDIHLYSSNKKNKYSYNSSDIICLKGCGNYYIVYYKSDGRIKQQIIRNTLSSIEEILNKKYFLRCHKSYILNCEKIDSVKGNLKNLKIHTEILDFEIPVSRNISKKDYQYLLLKAKV